MTYNHEKFIKNCLNSLNSLPVEITVVDNGSQDNTCRVIENEFPHINLIKSQDNLGYGGGVNLGVDKSHGDYLVVLNPDTIVEEDALEHLIKPLVNSSNLVTIPKALLYDGSRINTCGNIEHFTGLTFTRCLGHPKEEHCEQEIIGGLSGVCFALKRSDYQRIGGFDPKIFLYMEDAELSWRLSINNLKILYVPESVIYHDYTLEVSPEKIYHLEKGRYTILRKYFTKKKMIAFLPSFIMSEILTWGYSGLKGKEGLRNKINAIKDSRKMEIEKMNYESVDLFVNLDWRIPEKQLSYSIIDHTLRNFANLVFYMNFVVVLKIMELKASTDMNKNLSAGK